MIKLIIIGVVLLLLILVIIATLSFRKKIKFYTIKTNEAESSIKKALNKKKKYINKLKPLILEEIDQNNFLEGIEDFNVDNNDYLNNIKSLADFQDEITSIIDENDKLLNKEEIEKLIEKINDNEVELNASIKYYNNNANIFNQKIETFPANIIRIFFGYKRKEFYENKKREEFEILKNK